MFEWWDRFALDGRVSFGAVINPSGITLIMMALFVFLHLVLYLFVKEYR